MDEDMLEVLRVDGWAEAADDIERLERELASRDQSLQSLTPGGSEYVNDPKRCVAFVRSVRESQHEAIIQATKRAQQAEAQAAAMRGALEWAFPFASYHSLDQDNVDAAKAALSTAAGRKVLDVVEAAHVLLLTFPYDASDDLVLSNLRQALAAMGK